MVYAPDKRTINDYYTEKGNEGWSWPNLSYDTGTCLKGLRKNMTTKDSRFRGSDLKLVQE